MAEAENNQSLTGRTIINNSGYSRIKGKNQGNLDHQMNIGYTENFKPVIPHSKTSRAMQVSIKNKEILSIELNKYNDYGKFIGTKLEVAIKQLTDLNYIKKKSHDYDRYHKGNSHIMSKN